MLLCPQTWGMNELMQQRPAQRFGFTISQGLTLTERIRSCTQSSFPGSIVEKERPGGWPRGQMSSEMVALELSVQEGLMTQLSHLCAPY